MPDLGVEIDLNRGISGLCARTATSWRCDSSDRDPYVDRARCRELGMQSVLATPVSHLNNVLGVLEVFSSQKNAFSDQDVATVQLLGGLLVVAITRRGDENRTAGGSWVRKRRLARATREPRRCKLMQVSDVLIKCQAGCRVGCEVGMQLAAPCGRVRELALKGRG